MASTMDEDAVKDAGVIAVDIIGEKEDGNVDDGVERGREDGDNPNKGGSTGAAEEGKKGDENSAEVAGGEGAENDGKQIEKGGAKGSPEEGSGEDKEDDVDSSMGGDISSISGNGAAKKLAGVEKAGRKRAALDGDANIRRKKIADALKSTAASIEYGEEECDLDEMIGMFQKMKEQRDVENTQREHFKKEVDYDVGSFNLCNEKEERYATSALISSNWTVYQKMGRRLMKYLEVDAFVKYNQHNLQKNPKLEMTSWIKAYMDSIARIYVARDNPADVQKLCGIAYRWRLDFSVPLSVDDAAIDGVTMGLIYGKHVYEECQEQIMNSAPGLEDYCALPKGMRYVLELYSNKDKFQDWVYIARSNFVDGHLGLFAARQFDCGTPIGVYVGRTLHQYAVAGGKNPSQLRLNEDLKQTDMKFEPYTMLVRDKKCKLRIVEGDPLPKWQLSKESEASPRARVPMYMGMHFANDCLQPYRKDSKLADKAERETNIITEEDGVVIALKRINKGEECYLNYEDDWRRPKRHEKERDVAVGKKRKRGAGKKGN